MQLFINRFITSDVHSFPIPWHHLPGRRQVLTDRARPHAWRKMDIHCSMVGGLKLPHFTIYTTSTRFVGKPEGVQQCIFDLFWLFFRGGGQYKLGGSRGTREGWTPNHPDKSSTAFNLCGVWTRPENSKDPDRNILAESRHIRDPIRYIFAIIKSIQKVKSNRIGVHKSCFSEILCLLCIIIQYATTLVCCV